MNGASQTGRCKATTGAASSPPVPGFVIDDLLAEYAFTPDVFLQLNVNNVANRQLYGDQLYPAFTTSRARSARAGDADRALLGRPQDPRRCCSTSATSSTADELRAARARCSPARPGATAASTAGVQSALAKNNEQLPRGLRETRSAAADRAGGAEPAPRCSSRRRCRKQISPPLFNRYGGGANASATTSTTPCASFPAAAASACAPTSVHAVPGRPGRVRRRRAGRRGHLRRAARQAPGRRHGALSGHQRAPGRAGHARRARWRASSGSRAWCAATSSAACCYDMDMPPDAPAQPRRRDRPRR